MLPSDHALRRALIFCAAVLAPLARDAAAIELPAAGINPVGYNYWGTALPFVDVAHMGSKWATQQTTSLTTTGYPAALAPGDTGVSNIFTGNGGFYPTGQYTLRWQGTGNVQLTGANLSVVSSGP